jgi:hypothetical protein
MEIQGGLAVNGKAEQKKAGYRCHGRYGKTHVDPRFCGVATELRRGGRGDNKSDRVLVLKGMTRDVRSRDRDCSEKRKV